VKTVCVSGGFDPIHIGHVRYILAARELGDRLIVILNADSFLIRKKGFAFMPEQERAEVLRAVRGVDSVVIFESEQDTVIPALEALAPDIFAKGGDRTGPENTPEFSWCQEHGVEVIWNVGGGKSQSSQWLTAKIARKDG